MFSFTITDSRNLFHFTFVKFFAYVAQSLFFPVSNFYLISQFLEKLFWPICIFVRFEVVVHKKRPTFVRNSFSRTEQILLKSKFSCPMFFILCFWIRCFSILFQYSRKILPIKYFYWLSACCCTNSFPRPQSLKSFDKN